MIIFDLENDGRILVSGVERATVEFLLPMYMLWSWSCICCADGDRCSMLAMRGSCQLTWLLGSALGEYGQGGWWWSMAFVVCIRCELGTWYSAWGHVIWDGTRTINNPASDGNSDLVVLLCIVPFCRDAMSRVTYPLSIFYYPCSHHVTEASHLWWFWS